VTRRETFTNLSEVWSKEVELYSTNQDCVKMLVGNKVDKVSFLLKYMIKANEFAIVMNALVLSVLGK